MKPGITKLDNPPTTKIKFNMPAVGRDKVFEIESPIPSFMGNDDLELGNTCKYSVEISCPVNIFYEKIFPTHLTFSMKCKKTVMYRCGGCKVASWRESSNGDTVNMVIRFSTLNVDTGSMNLQAPFTPPPPKPHAKTEDDRRPKFSMWTAPKDGLEGQTTIVPPTKVKF